MAVALPLLADRLVRSIERQHYTDAAAALDELLHIAQDESSASVLRSVRRTLNDLSATVATQQEQRRIELADLTGKSRRVSAYRETQGQEAHTR